jgi:hypothetical protein
MVPAVLAFILSSAVLVLIVSCVSLLFSTPSVSLYLSHTKVLAVVESLSLYLSYSKIVEVVLVLVPQIYRLPRCGMRRTDGCFTRSLSLFLSYTKVIEASLTYGFPRYRNSRTDGCFIEENDVEEEVRTEKLLIRLPSPTSRLIHSRASSKRL